MVVVEFQQYNCGSGGDGGGGGVVESKQYNCGSGGGGGGGGVVEFKQYNCGGGGGGGSINCSISRRLLVLVNGCSKKKKAKQNRTEHKQKMNHLL